MQPPQVFAMTPFHVTSFFVISVFTSLTYALDVSISLQASSNVPKISPSHVSLSLEMDRWTEWAGTVSRNEFFFNTLDNLKQITGQPPNVRIGGNTMDATTFRADVQVCISFSTIFVSILHHRTTVCARYIPCPICDNSVPRGNECYRRRPILRSGAFPSSQ